MVARPRIALFALALSVGMPAPAPAATASLVADIDPNLASRGTSSFRPQQLTRAGSRVVFVADEPSSGVELWTSDGTPLGTEMLRDNCPGPCTGEVKMLGTAGGIAYFRGGEEDVDRGLWRTDGTPAGTFRLIDLERDPETTLALGSKFLLQECRNQFSCRLWASDGTRDGTVVIREGRSLGGLTAFGNQALYVDRATQSQSQNALWRTDGTAAGTAQFLVLPAGAPGLLTVAGTRLYFLANDAEGPELWTSDGTVAGTRRLTSFAVPQPFAPTRFLQPTGTSIDFLADDVTGSTDLWTSDGTPAGTRRVTDFGFDHPFQRDFWGSQLKRIGNQRFFLSTAGRHGARLWQSNGTPASTRRVPGVPSLGEESHLVRVGNSVLFGAGNELWATDGTTVRTLSQGMNGLIDLVPVSAEQVYLTTGSGIWRSDGTAAGTARLIPYREDFDSYPFEAVAVADGRVLFSAHDGGAYGKQLWVSDGTAAGTTLLSVAYNNGESSAPTLGAEIGGALVFTACDGQQRSFWRTTADGAAVPLAGTLAIGCVSGQSNEDLGPFAVAGGFAYAARSGSIYRTDGTDAGTRLLISLPNSSASPQKPFAFRGEVLFPALHHERGLSFWTLDGTPAGTVPRFTLPQIFTIDHLAVVGPEFYFSVRDSPSANGLWRSDGTAAGTRRITEASVTFSDRLEFTRAGGAVYFLARQPSDGNVLWRSDGTAAGTAPVPRPADGFQGLGSDPKGLAELGGALLYFSRLDSRSSRQGLFRTDGTAAGTTLIAALGPLAPEPFGFPQRPLTSTARLGNRLYFAGTPTGAGPGVGGELWATDGTAAGTVLIKDIAPGSRSSFPHFLTVVGGRLFFAANDGVHGFEVWESDGTAAGTRLVLDIAPGGSSSHPEKFIVAGDRLYFTADDGVSGREVWSLPLAGGPTCRPSATALCLNGGRFRAEAGWRDFQGNAGSGKAVSLSADTGSFWFFDPANLEVVLKVLDGRGNNGHFWTFYGALSNVEYTLTVTDTQTGAARRYINPVGRLASVGDTVAFGPLGASAPGLSLAPAAPEAPPLVVRNGFAPRVDKAPCAPSSSRLCLNGGRFALEARWRDFAGRTGSGAAVALTSDTGYFWFFDAANVETVVKVLDGRAANGRFWLFYGALSNVEYTLTVTDTETGAVKTYTNPLGRFASGADTAAF
jgi:ELWxxDGT repeat protein